MSSSPVHSPVARRPVPCALTIAGSDPSGGAGLQADLKTFHQHGVYGASVVTLITAQNTRGVEAVHLLPPELVRQQLAAVVDDLRPGALKTGALGAPALVEAVAEAIAAWSIDAPLVVDPVLVSKHGHPLASEQTRAALVASLLPRAALLTPNLHEAQLLLGGSIETLAQAEQAAAALATLGPRAVLLKAAGLAESRAAGMAIDILFADGRAEQLVTARLETPHTHGTGCTLSAAITARLAAGAPLREAVAGARRWLLETLRHPPAVGHGIGPVDHFATVAR